MYAVSKKTRPLIHFEIISAILDKYEQLLVRTRNLS